MNNYDDATGSVPGSGAQVRGGELEAPCSSGYEAKAARRKRGPKPRPALTRVLARIEVRDMGFATPCWVFTGATAGRGKYGKVGSRIDGRTVFELTHRVVWQAAYGPIPQPLQLDHLCGVTNCLNVGHLSPCTAAENNRRARERRRRAAAADDLTSRDQAEDRSMP